MKTFFRNATIVAVDKVHGTRPFRGDLLVSGTTIAAIGPALQLPEGATVVDCSSKLVMPGLVNAHTHSSETFFRGRYEKMPLEVWLLYAYPLLMGPLIDPRMIYLRSLLLAMESLKSGVTMLSDDFFDPPAHDLDRLGAAFAAYDDAGIRANVSSAAMNIHTLDALPFAREVMPAELRTLLDFGPPITANAYVDYCAAAIDRFDGRAGRLKFMVAPSAPQRCTADLLDACYGLASERKLQFHTHVLETITQAVTGPELYGKSLIRHLADIGVLGRNTVIAHSVWVDDEDIALMGEAGCSIAHNAVSNQKLGAGVAPVRRLKDAGVNISLGTDGISSNDTARIFDVMRVAGLIHSTTGPNYESWLAASDVVEAATMGGARSALLDEVTGSLEAGKAADLLVLDLNSLAFTPCNDIAKHLVFSENGSSIELVMVNGEVVVRDGAFTRIDANAILAEIRAAMPAYLAEHTRVEARNSIFEPAFAEIHRRASLRHAGTYRYAGDAPAWPSNRAWTP